MKHPEANEWIAFLYGEVSREARQDLDAHLAVCPECARQLGRWRSTMGLLDVAGVPERKPAARVGWSGALRWAAAAVVLLGLGLALGRQGTVSRRDLERQLGELQGRLQADSVGRREADLKAIADATMQATRAENRAFLDEFLRRYQAARLEDRKDLAAALQAIDERRGAEIAELRGGLASLAASTGTGFDQTRTQMRMLTSYLPARGGEAGEGGAAPDERKP